MKYYIPVLLLTIIISSVPFYAYSETRLEIYPNTGILGPFVNFSDRQQVEKDFEKLPSNFFKTNKSVLPGGLSLVNSLGYQNSKEIIKPFPHFSAGVIAGAGIYGLDRIDSFDGSDKPSIPSGGVNGGFHAGTGIDEKMDISFKFFSLGIFYTPEYSYSKSENDFQTDIEVADTSMYSLGGRVRYRLLNSKAGFPKILAFRGIMLNCSMDYISASVHSSIEYDKTLSGVSFTVKDPFDTTYEEDKNIDIKGITSNKLDITSSLYTITPDIFVNAEFLYIFSIYTGPSIALNFGSMDINITGNGNVSNLESVTIFSETAGRDIEMVAANSELGSAKFRSINKLKPELIFYKWTLGMEIDLWIMQLNVEAATLMNSAMFKDITNVKNNFTAQFGVNFSI